MLMWLTCGGFCDLAVLWTIDFYVFYVMRCVGNVNWQDTSFEKGYFERYLSFYDLCFKNVHFITEIMLWYLLTIQ